MTRLNASEAEFCRTACQMAGVLGWLAMHHPDSRHLVGDAGGPDLVLLHPTRGWLFAELKIEKRKRSRAQARWADTARQAGSTIHLIRCPEGLGELEELLRGR